MSQREFLRHHIDIQFVSLIALISLPRSSTEYKHFDLAILETFVESFVLGIVITGWHQNNTYISMAHVL